MRKIKFLMVLALLVFVFSGCGGSADSGEDESEEIDPTTYHETIINYLTGEWKFDSGSGRASTTSTSDLKNFENCRISFSDIEFGSDSQMASGKGKVFYSFTCIVGNAKEKTTITSYSKPATSIYRELNLTRISDTEWFFEDSDCSMLLEFDDEKMNIELSGRWDFEDMGKDCVFSIKGTLSKVSTKTIEDYDPSDEYEEEPEEIVEEKTIEEILEGTWLFATGDETGNAIATVDSDDTELTLRLASNITLKISSIDLEPENNTTSLTGTVKVDYAQNWTAYNQGVKLGKDGAFAFGKANETMKIIKLANDRWRIEDTRNLNENIIVTITSEDQIATVWAGTTTVSLDQGPGSYTYDISCSFRKQ